MVATTILFAIASNLFSTAKPKSKKIVLCANLFWRYT